jgi:AraC-like DNA-binding protein/ligand-binding sensor protein
LLKYFNSAEGFSDILNLANLSQFQNLFYRFTGLPVSICNFDLETITFYPKTQRSSFCKVVQTSKEGIKRCRASDLSAIEKALKKKRPYIYRCHAGLVNVTIPIIIDDSYVGSIISGQVLTTPLTPQYIDELKKNLYDLPIKEERLIRVLQNIKVISEEKLRLATQFLSLIATYIVEAEMRNELFKKIELEEDVTEEVETLKDRLKRSMPFGGPSNLEKSEDGDEKSAVECAVEFINEHLHEDLTLPVIADVVYLSPTYFARLFKNEIGLTFHEYLTQSRIRKAAHLLKETPLSISEVSQRVGYSDPNYFSQVFKRLMKISPSDFRKFGVLNI